MHLPLGDTQLVQIMDASLADAARRAKDWLVCRPGCTQCCHGAFAINALDALRLRTGMDALRIEQPALAAAVESRSRAWLDEHRADFPGDLATGQLGDSDADRERFEDFANDAACPALNPATGLCDVYAWRPMTCRVFGPPVRMGEGDALGCCELCFIGVDQAVIASCEMSVPHELEDRLLNELAGTSAPGPKRELPESRETIVAFALLS